MYIRVLNPLTAVVHKKLKAAVCLSMYDLQWPPSVKRVNTFSTNVPFDFNIKYSATYATENWGNVLQYEMSIKLLERNLVLLQQKQQKPEILLTRTVPMFPFYFNVFQSTNWKTILEGKINISTYEVIENIYFSKKMPKCFELRNIQKNICYCS